MEKEYIEREAAINVVANNPHNVAFKTIKTIQGIKEIPTADVVPKSECKECGEKASKVIVQLQEEIEGLKKRLLPSYCQSCSEEEAIKIGKEYGRAEVAREIFEEIERNSSYCVASHNGEEIYETKTYTISALKLAELKKKYTGEKGEEKDNGRA